MTSSRSFIAALAIMLMVTMASSAPTPEAPLASVQCAADGFCANAPNLRPIDTDNAYQPTYAGQHADYHAARWPTMPMMASISRAKASARVYISNKFAERGATAATANRQLPRSLRTFGPATTPVGSIKDDVQQMTIAGLLIIVYAFAVSGYDVRSSMRTTATMTAGMGRGIVRRYRRSTSIDLPVVERPAMVQGRWTSPSIFRRRRAQQDSTATASHSVDMV